MNEKYSAMGQKIRAMRLSRHMTQSQLAGNSISRNMLSLIETGSAVPSLNTLSDLAQRLEVPIGYFFAEDEKEAAQFMKMSMIDSIRRAYAEKKYAQCLALCDSLSCRDDEIHLMMAECCLALAAAAAQQSMLATASAHLEKANSAARECVYLRDSFCATVDFLTLLLDSVRMHEIPALLSQPHAYSLSRIPPEMFAYIAALRAIDRQEPDTAEAIMKSGLLHSALYIDFLTARLMATRGDIETACATLRRLYALSDPGFFTRYHMLNAIESWTGAMNDFKAAYQYSSQKVRLLEQFSR